MSETETIEQRLERLEKALARHDAILVKLRAIAMAHPVGRTIVKAIGLG